MAGAKVSTLDQTVFQPTTDFLSKQKNERERGIASENENTE